MTLSLGGDTFENIVGNVENGDYQHFLLFSTMFSILSWKEIIILATFNLSSAMLSLWSCKKFSHLVESFNTPEKEKHCEKRRKCWLTAFFSISHTVFYSSQRKFFFLSHIFFFFLLSAKFFNLDRSEFCPFGKELTHSHTITPFDASGKKIF